MQDNFDATRAKICVMLPGLQMRAACVVAKRRFDSVEAKARADSGTTSGALPICGAGHPRDELDSVPAISFQHAAWPRIRRTSTSRTMSYPGSAKPPTMRSAEATGERCLATSDGLLIALWHPTGRSLYLGSGWRGIRVWRIHLKSFAAGPARLPASGR